MPEPLAIVLAAGKGARMRSDLPKVLAPALGRPLVRHVVDALRGAGVHRIVLVVGYGADLVRQAFAGEPGVGFATQTEQLGTGHAVMTCREHLQGHDGPVLVVTGDSPLLQPASVRALLEAYARDRPACLLGTGRRADPAGLGRILRDPAGGFLGIVEERDATEAQRAITEVNMSTYVFRPDALLTALDGLRCENAQGEYYLTDCPGMLRDAGEVVDALAALAACETLSVNTPEELAVVEREMLRLGYEPTP